MRADIVLALVTIIAFSTLWAWALATVRKTAIARCEKSMKSRAANGAGRLMMREKKRSVIDKQAMDGYIKP